MIADVEKSYHDTGNTPFRIFVQRDALAGAYRANTGLVNAPRRPICDIGGPDMRTAKTQILALGLALLCMPAPLMAQNDMPKMMYKSTETPSYTVVSAQGGLEIRDYAPRITAEVTVSGTRSAAIGKGFRVLASYIFGNNIAGAKVAMTSPVGQVASEKIAMTSPVAQSAAGADWTVQFTMPSGYDLQSLPVPKDPAIRFVSHAGTRQVALQFSGLANGAALDKQEALLREKAGALGLGLGAGPFYYFYDDPFTLPWNKRNEVAFDLVAGN